jgi:anti-sigma regulatory factor (Ser/Thr protein kinase)
MLVGAGPRAARRRCVSAAPDRGTQRHANSRCPQRDVSATCNHAARPEQDGFRHEAFVYAGLDELVGGVVPFVGEGVAAGEPAMVAAGAAKIDALREALGADAEHVLFADMAVMGRNPARIIPAWREFLDTRSPPGGRVRGVGEPIWAGRSPAELVESQRHESLLNLAFADAAGFRLLCPYDAAALEPAVVEEARSSHPFVLADGATGASEGYRGLEASSAPFRDPLPAPESQPRELAFDGKGLGAVRRLVAEHARSEGLGAAGRYDLVVAANEVATNSVVHGGGAGAVRVWREGDALLCEVRDRGRIEEPLAGRVRPAPGQVGRFGLWLANQLCDLVQVRALPEGTVVRLHVRLPG